jgi:hypothetical protein
MDVKQWFTKWKLLGQYSTIPFNMLATVPEAAFDVVDSFTGAVDTSWGPLEVDLTISIDASMFHVNVWDEQGESITKRYNRLADARRWISTLPRVAPKLFKRLYDEKYGPED